MKRAYLIMTSILTLSFLTNCGLKSNKSWYEHEDWWNYCSCDDKNIRAKDIDIGKIVNVKINQQNHRVRLIGLEHDNIANGGDKRHCAFEFVDFISDSNGYSLATFWNDTNDEETSNHCYKNSTIRKNLIGEGNANNYGWYEKGSSTISSTYVGPLLSMLPIDLANAIKPVTKSVNEKINGVWVNSEINDKLFLLTPKEMGYIDVVTEGNTYTYYRNHSEKIDAIRIKKQIKGYEGSLREGVAITDSKCKSAKNFAGYNDEKPNNGGLYYLRSPDIHTDKTAYYLDSAGNASVSTIVYNDAIAIAPAFAI